MRAGTRWSELCMMSACGLVLSLLVPLAGCSNGGGGPGNSNDNTSDNSSNDNSDDDDNDNESPQIELTEPHRNPTAWELVAEGIGTDGLVSKDTALKAFALTLGDIPGVTPPAATTNGAPCGSTALRWVTQHADELSAAELAAIRAALAPMTAPKRAQGESAKLMADHSCTIGNDAVSEDAEDTEQYRTIVNQELAKVEAAFGKPLGIPVYITLGLGKSGSDTLAWASPQTSGDCGADAATSCRVQILINREELNDQNRLRATLAHELTHCFQATWMAAVDALSQPEWLLEGFPDYVGESLNPAADRVSFLVYTQTPLRRLFVRTYDAQGFFFHLANVATNIYQRYEAAFKLKGSSAAFAHLVAGLESEFGDTWASSFALEPARGEAWFMPDAPAAALAGVSAGTLVNGKSFTANPGEAGTRIAHVDFDADIVVFKVTGGKHGRIGWDDAGDSLVSELDGAAYCRRADGCECPPGTKGNPPKTPIPSIGAIVSATGLTVTTTVDITGASLEDYCKEEDEEPTPTGVDPCVVGVWVSDVWALPGPIPDLDGSGGNNAVVVINANGHANWNFDAMQPITVHDDQIDVTTEQYTRGTATATIAANADVWTVTNPDLSGLEAFAIDNILGEYPLQGGPGLFVLLGSGSYSCSGNTLSYLTTDPVENAAITVTLHKQQ